MKLTVKAIRAGKRWAIEIPEIERFSIQTRHLDQVEAMVKDVTAGLTEHLE